VFKQLLIGFVYLGLYLTGLAALFVIFIGVVVLFGLLIATAVVICGTAALTLAAVLAQARRYGHGFRIISQYGPDEADRAGSTARYGRPHDPYNAIIPNPNRRPYDPEIDRPLHKPPRPLHKPHDRTTPL
jgi:hypothetical protein